MFEYILFQIGYRSLELIIILSKFSEVNEYLNPNCNQMDLIDFITHLMSTSIQVVMRWT